jgi:hypothetical protein
MRLEGRSLTYTAVLEVSMMKRERPETLRYGQINVFDYGGRRASLLLWASSVANRTSGFEGFEFPKIRTDKKY